MTVQLLSMGVYQPSKTVTGLTETTRRTCCRLFTQTLLRDKTVNSGALCFLYNCVDWHSVYFLIENFSLIAIYDRIDGE